MSNVIKSIQFKRGLKSALIENLKGDNKPLRGEPIWEIDTNKLKIGDGSSDYEDLPYIAGDGSSSSDVVVFGSYDKETDVFWKEEAKINALPRLTTRLYIDRATMLVYDLQDNKYTLLIALADQDTYGLSKLYGSTGQNVDGSMTQKAITDGFNNIVDVNEEDEILDIKNDF